MTDIETAYILIIKDIFNQHGFSFESQRLVQLINALLTKSLVSTFNNQGLDIANDARNFRVYTRMIGFMMRFYATLDNFCEYYLHRYFPEPEYVLLVMAAIHHTFAIYGDEKYSRRPLIKYFSFLYFEFDFDLALEKILAMLNLHQLYDVHDHSDAFDLAKVSSAFKITFKQDPNLLQKLCKQDHDASDYLPMDYKEFLRRIAPTKIIKSQSFTIFQVYQACMKIHRDSNEDNITQFGCITNKR